MNALLPREGADRRRIRGVRTAAPPDTARVIVESLAAAGVGHLFGHVGDPTAEALVAADRGDCRFVACAAESSAGLMALAYGQLTGLPGVAVSRAGPGAPNLVQAVAAAGLDHVPMIAIAGQFGSEWEPLPAPPVVDPHSLFAPICKWAATVRPHSVATTMRRALRTAVAERPGPVHLTVAADTLEAAAIDSICLPPPLQSHRVAQQIAAAGAFSDPAVMLRAARRPVILAGHAAVRADAGAALRRLAERIGCPVVVAPTAKGVLPETDPHFAGTLDRAGNAYLWGFLRRADLLLAVGFDVVEPIRLWNPMLPTIHIDSVPNTDQVYAAGLEIVGDVAAALDGLAAEPLGEPRWPEAEIATHRVRLRHRLAAGRVAGRLNPSDVVDVVRAAMPPDALATTDVGPHRAFVEQGWTAHGPRSVLAASGVSTIGFALPAATTAALLDPVRPVVGFTGGAGFIAMQTALRGTAALKLAPLIVVLCDGNQSRIECAQVTCLDPHRGAHADAAEVATLAQAMGCDSIAVDSAARLERVLATARATDRPLVIGAQVDPSQYAGQG